jgi:hypothetical protein
MDMDQVEFLLWVSLQMDESGTSLWRMLGWMSPCSHHWSMRFLLILALGPQEKFGTVSWCSTKKPQHASSPCTSHQCNHSSWILCYVLRALSIAPWWSYWACIQHNDADLVRETQKIIRSFGEFCMYFHKIGYR